MEYSIVIIMLTAASAQPKQGFVYVVKAVLPYRESQYVKNAVFREYQGMLVATPNVNFWEMQVIDQNGLWKTKKPEKQRQRKEYKDGLRNRQQRYNLSIMEIKNAMA